MITINRIDGGEIKIIIPTRVTYTEESGLEQWQSNIIGTLSRASIPNIEDAQTVMVGNQVTDIASETFKSCTSLRSVIIYDGTTKIGSEAFRMCYALQDVTIPDSVTDMSGCPFWACTSIKTLSIPDSVTQFDGVPGCENLESLKLSSGVSILNGYGGDAFRDCSKLHNLIIPEGVIKIHGNLLCGAGCGIKHIIIPKSLIEIESDEYSTYPFISSPYLTDITFSGRTISEVRALPNWEMSYVQSHQPEYSIFCWGAGIYYTGLTQSSPTSNGPVKIHCTDGILTITPNITTTYYEGNIYSGETIDIEYYS